MKQIILFFLLVFLPFLAQSQIDRKPVPMDREQPPRTQRDDRATIEQDEPTLEKAPISLYKIISIENDTTFVDTTLNIYKDYRFNYLRTDNFELLPFSNVGQTYNRLAHNFSEEDEILPLFGAQARHYNFFEVEDIFYYHVPTPFTELYFRTVFEQGQTLDSFFTINTSPNLNFSVAYKGLRSLGFYQHILVSTGNFRATVSYSTPNGRYHLNTHFVSQDLLNEENGGLTQQSLQQYISKNPEFEDRSRLEVNFEDAQSTLFGKRFFLEHSFDLVDSVDSLSHQKISVGHRLNFSDKEYLFEQANAHALFGPSFERSGLRDGTELEEFYNEAFVEYSGNILGRLKAGAGHTHFNYGYNTVLDLESGFIENRLIGNVYSVNAAYEKQLGGFLLDSEAKLNVVGEFDGYSLEGRLSYSFDEDFLTTLGLNMNSSAPNYNFLLYQSDYINYNWRNRFSNENNQTLSFRLLAPNLLNLDLDYTHVGNYTYFGLDEEGFTSPFQHSGNLNYFKITGQREFRLGKFALNNTLLYQEVLDGKEVLNVPSFVTRNTFYYSDHWFQRALFLQTGITFKYFTNYHMNGYDPVLAEFYVQNSTEMEGFPTADFFFNGKIRQARIFFKLERVDALLTGNNSFAAPGYPYRDFAIRFGLVWNFFM